MEFMHVHIFTRGICTFFCILYALMSPVIAMSESLTLDWQHQDVAEFIKQIEHDRCMFGISDQEFVRKVGHFCYDATLSCAIIPKDEFIFLVNFYLSSCVLSFEKTFLIQKIERVMTFIKICQLNEQLRNFLDAYVKKLRNSYYLPKSLATPFFILLRHALGNVALEALVPDNKTYKAIKNMLASQADCGNDCIVLDTFNFIMNAVYQGDRQLVKLCFFLQNYSGPEILALLYHSLSITRGREVGNDAQRSIQLFLLERYISRSKSCNGNDCLVSNHDTGNCYLENFDYSAALAVYWAFICVRYIYNNGKEVIQEAHFCSHVFEERSFFTEVAQLLYLDDALFRLLKSGSFSPQDSLLSYAIAYGSLQTVSGLLSMYETYLPRGCYQSLSMSDPEGECPLDRLIERHCDNGACQLVDLLIKVASGKPALLNRVFYVTRYYYKPHESLSRNALDHHCWDLVAKLAIFNDVR